MKLYYGAAWSERYRSVVKKVKPKILIYNQFSPRNRETLDTSHYTAYLAWWRNSHLVYKSCGMNFYIAVGNINIGDALEFDRETFLLTNMSTGIPVQFRRLEKIERVFL